MPAQKIYIALVFILLILFSVLILDKNVDTAQIDKISQSADVTPLNNCTPKIEERTVRGSSMSPFLKDGDDILVDFNYFQCGKLPERNDMIIYDFNAQNIDLIKMIKTIPGDNFEIDEENKVLIVNGEEVKNNEGKIYKFSNQNIKMLSLYEKSFEGIMPDKLYFIFGDSPGGIDSGKFGPIQLEKILGKVIGI